METVVGYSGSANPAETRDPTYRNVKDFAESIRITYNPEVVDYEDLLAMFFSFHSPSGFGGSQYRSAIFAHTPEQRDLALMALKGPQRKYEKVVALEDADDFYAGEEYHQKYLQKAMRSGGPMW